jgi:xanthine dehydrogenase accessory factor
MRDIWDDLTAWGDAGRAFALARVVETWGSSPRAVGSAMIISDTTQVAGSVSGGCIEGAVIEAAGEVLASGEPQYLNYGVDDETAWSVGLSCGGEVSVFVEKHEIGPAPTWGALRTAIANNEPSVLLSVIGESDLRNNTDGTERHPLLVRPDGSTVGQWDPTLTAAAVENGLAAHERRQSSVVEIGEVRVFVHFIARREQILIIGAGHISVALVQYASLLDLDTVVIEPRQVFARPERFPVAPTKLLPSWPEQVLQGWDLNEETYAVLLTHDPKIDDQALHALLRSPVAYIGALGSRRTHAKRRERLREAGFTGAEIDRIDGPIGLNIGADTPAEIAMSIAAKIVATRRQ